MLLCLVLPVLASAQDPGPDLDERSAQVLRQMSDYLGAQHEFGYEASVSYEVVQESGRKLEFEISGDVSVRRPDHVRVRLDRDGARKQIFYDGKRLTVFLEQENAYGQNELTGTIDDMLTYVRNELGTNLPLMDLLYSDVWELLQERVDLGFYVGEYHVDGVPCHHLALSNESVDAQIWVQSAGPPVPRKLVLTFRGLPGAPERTARITNWNLVARHEKGHFTFSPPRGADRITIVPQLPFPVAGEGR
jgi:hypothetical protein